MNIRNLLIASVLTIASGSAFAGKAPVVLGGFQVTGTVVSPKSVSNAASCAEKGGDCPTGTAK